MRPVFALILLLSVAHAYADEASCTYTYNQYSKAIVKTCRGSLPVPGLNMADRTSLMARRVQSCIIKVEFDRGTKQSRVTPAVCS